MHLAALGVGCLAKDVISVPDILAMKTFELRGGGEDRPFWDLSGFWHYDSVINIFCRTLWYTQSVSESIQSS